MNVAVAREDMSVAGVRRRGRAEMIGCDTPGGAARRSARERPEESAFSDTRS